MPRTTALSRSAAAAKPPPPAQDDAPVAAKKAKRAKTAPVQTNDHDELDALLSITRPEDALSQRVALNAHNKTDTDHLQKGMLLCRPARLVVLEAGGGQSQVRNQDIHAVTPHESDWCLADNLIARQCWNADQYTEVRQENMSTMASLLRDQVGDVICKVEFTKEPEAVAMTELLMKGAAMIEAMGLGDAEKKRQYKRLYERTRQGEYRIMRGYILRDEDMSTKETDTGMIRFLDADLMAQGKFAERQINLRNIQALTFKLVRYERK